LDFGSLSSQNDNFLRIEYSMFDDRYRKTNFMMKNSFRWCVIATVAFGVAVRFVPDTRAQTAAQKTNQQQQNRKQQRALRIVSAARAQVGDVYDAEYVSLKYPNGDVPRGRGACTDVIVRALRAVGFDLQRLIYEDKRRNPQKYPAKWRANRLDKSIDHRRVLNQVVYFARFGQTLTTRVDSSTRKSWKAGDIVAWKFDNGLDHIGIISDKTNERGWPLVIHNVGGCAENDVLNAWKIVGHYRFPR